MLSCGSHHLIFLVHRQNSIVVVHSSDRRRYLDTLGVQSGSDSGAGGSHDGSLQAAGGAAGASNDSVELDRSQSSEWRALAPLSGSQGLIQDYELGMEIGKGSFGAVAMGVHKVIHPNPT